MKVIFTSRFHENQASIDNCLIQLLILNQDYQLSQLLILNGTRKKKKNFKSDSIEMTISTSNAMPKHDAP